MIVTPEFPEHRLQDPRRQAEWRVYQEIAGSQAPGRALYEMRAGLHVPQLDFGIWLQDLVGSSIIGPVECEDRPLRPLADGSLGRPESRCGRDALVSCVGRLLIGWSCLLRGRDGRFTTPL